MNETVQQRYHSAEERYATYNFQRRGDIAAVQEILHTPATASRPVLLLSGPDGIGRRYLLESAVWSSQRGSIPVEYLALDLTGYAEGKDWVQKFVEFQAERFARRGRSVAAEAVSWIQEHASLLADDLPGAATVATLLSVGSSIRQWRSLEARIPGPRRPSLEALGLLLGNLTREATVLLHVTDSSLLNSTLRNWLLLEARSNRRLLLAFSCQPGEEDEGVAPGAATLRLELAPLERSELQAVIDDLYAPHRFPPELVAALEDYSQGWPEWAALKMKDLVASDLLFTDSGVWTLGEDGTRSPAFVEQFRSVLYGLRKLRTASGPLDRFLDLAALCGEFVPADLVIAHLALTEEAREELLDRIDDKLIVGEDAAVPLFRDYQYEHPSFPGLLIYGFFESFLGRLLVEEIAEQDRPRLAAAFLAFLRRHVPVGTRGVAKMFLSVARFLEAEEEEEEIRQELAYWVGLEEAEALTQLLVEDLREGRVSPASMLPLAYPSHYHWPAYRRWAVLEALAVSGSQLSLEERADFHWLRTEILRNLARFAEALQESEIAMSIAQSLGDGQFSQRFASAVASLGIIYLEMGDFPSARARLQEALRLQEVMGEVQASTLHALAGVVAMQGDIARALELWNQVLQIEEAIGDGKGKAATLAWLGWAAYQQGDIARALELWNHALQIQEEIGDVKEKAVTMNNMAEVIAQQGDITRALDLWNQSLQIQEAIGDVKGRAITLSHMAAVIAQQGEIARALDLWNQAFQVFEAIGEVQSKAVTLHQMAGVIADQGEIARALDLWNQALTIQEAIGNVQGKAVMLSNMAKVIAQQGEIARALELWNQALKIQEAIGNLPGKAATLTRLARVIAEQGEIAQALDLWNQALQIQEATGDLQYKALTLANLAWAGQRGDAGEQRRLYLESAQSSASVRAWIDLAAVLEDLGLSDTSDGRIFLAQAFWLATRAELPAKRTLNLAQALAKALGSSHPAAPFVARAALELIQARSERFPEAAKLIDDARALLADCATTGAIPAAPDAADRFPAVRRALEDIVGDQEWLFDRALFQ
jgi:tetratricopeptide (TPR) repeat protein